MVAFRVVVGFHCAYCIMSFGNCDFFCVRRLFIITTLQIVTASERLKISSCGTKNGFVCCVEYKSKCETCLYKRGIAHVQTKKVFFVARGIKSDQETCL
jgi:hypothetical protein